MKTDWKTDLGKIAIIGTRQPDDLQLSIASVMSAELSHQGYRIATGGAYGIDQAAMLHCDPQTHLIVYLPWLGYNSAIIPEMAGRIVYTPAIHQPWTQSVNKHHPRVSALTRGSFALHARNYGIIEGAELVLAFPDPTGDGGTGQGVRVAKALGIPLLEIRKGTETLSLGNVRVRVTQLLQDRKVTTNL